LEIARAYGPMLQQGWQPQRNIILASWDGEEFGLLGSTAWVEAHANDMENTGVVYLNVDVAVCGSNFGVAATPSLIAVIEEASSQVIDPNTKLPLSEVWDGFVGTLGSGSDFTAFLDHFGISSMDMGFSGPYGVYHSTYDDYFWMSNFGDPTFAYHAAISQFWGLIALKFIDDVVLPFNYTIYGDYMDSYFTNIKNLLAQYNMTMDLTLLNQAIGSFQRAAKKADADIWNIINNGGDANALNSRLVATEREFLSRYGLPQRPYYKHVIQAPGLYEGYAADIFPGVAQSIRSQNLTEAIAQDKVLIDCINSAAAVLYGPTRAIKL